MKKKLLISLSSLLALLLGGVLGGHAWLKAKLQKDQIVAQMEEAWNCRAEIASTEVSFFRSPAQVRLVGIKLAPRDGEFAKPFAQRAPLDDASPLVNVGTAALDVELSSLLSGRLDVKELKLKNVKVRTVIDEEGDSSLEAMFDSPDSEYGYEEEAVKEHRSADAKESASQQDAKKGDCDGGPAEDARGATPEPSPDAKREKSSDAKKEPKPKKKKKVRIKKDRKPFKAGDLVVALKVDEASVDSAEIEILNPSADSRIVFSKVDFTLKAIDVEAADLAHHNSCDLVYAGHVLVDKPRAELKSADFDVSGSGSIAPFDRESGEWNPDLTINATVKKGGLVGGSKLSDQLKAKDLKKMSELGLDFGDLLLGGVLQEDASTDVHAFHGKMKVKQETRLVVPDYDITVAKDGTISAGEDRIDAHVVLVVHKELSTRILAQAKKSSTEHFGEDLAGFGEAVIRKTLMDDKEQLVLPFRLKGKLSQPEVSLDTVVDSIKDGVKDLGRSLLEGLLKGGSKK